MQKYTNEELEEAIEDSLNKYYNALDELWKSSYRIIRVAGLYGVDGITISKDATINSGEVMIYDRHPEEMTDEDFFTTVNNVKNILNDCLSIY